MEMITPLIRLFAHASRRLVLFYFSCLLLVNLTNGIGLLLLVPMLGLLYAQSPEGRVEDRIFGFFEGIGLPISFTSILIVFAALVALRSLVQLFQDRSSIRLQTTIVDALRLKCFAALMNVEWRWLSSSRRSDHINLLLNEVSRIGAGLHFAIGLCVSLTTIAVYLVVAFLLSSKMTLLALALGGAVTLLLARYRWQALHLGREETRASRELQHNAYETLSGIKLAKTLGNEAHFLRTFGHALAELQKQHVSFSDSTGLSRSLFQMVSAVLLVALSYVALVYWRTNPNELIVLIVIFGRLAPMLMQAQQQFHDWMHTLPAIEETERILNECQIHAEPIARGVQPATTWSVKESVHLHNVSLFYGGRDAPALSDVSITFASNSTTAIIGASGAGKSTLADVLVGLISPNMGSMFVDDREIDEVTRRDWRKAVAYVQQDSFLFHDTIRANLLFSNPSASDADLRSSLDKASAQFVWALPQGIDTVVGDGGSRLSGGERQRIALARALLRKPALLILDEATSALDISNEARIREAIDNLHGDLTVIIIGHRLAMLERADQVVVLDNGRIAAKGSWKDVQSTLQVQSLLSPANLNAPFDVK